MHEHKIEKHIKHDNNLILLGNPNVGKSVIFNLLTGRYVTVSNYPGTTVELTQGLCNINNKDISVIDTPGINNLIPQSEDERVSRDILLNTEIYNVIQVADAKNLRRALFISIQLAEASIPFILNINMIDEAVSRGISIETSVLSKILQVKVITTIATQKKGIKALISAIPGKNFSSIFINYSKEIEACLKKIIPLLPEMQVSKRYLGLLLLANDTSIYPILTAKMDTANLEKVKKLCTELQSSYSKPISYYINRQRLKKVNNILKQVFAQESKKKTLFLQN